MSGSKHSRGRETTSVASHGTYIEPIFHGSVADTANGILQNRRFFSYRADVGEVGGYAVSIMFTLDKPAKDVWPHFRDFNKWHGSHHHYSGVVGDLEGKTYRIGSSPTEPGLYDYHVIKVIPEHLIVVGEPVPADGSTGGVKRGFHVFTLNEHEGRTVVVIQMEHSMAVSDKPVEEALGFWKQMVPELQAKWRDHFIPTLRKLVDAR